MDPRDRRIEAWATQVAQRGLATPAVMLLDLGRPFGPLAQNCAEGLALVLPGAGAALLRDLAHLLNDPAAAARFVAALERDPR